MISEVTVLLLATFVRSDIEIGNCYYYSNDSSCTGLVLGKCFSLCGRVYDCSTMNCSQAQVLWEKRFNNNMYECYDVLGSDFKGICVGDDSSDDNGENGNDNGSDDNDGNDDGGDDNGVNDNGGDDHSQDDDNGLSVMQCRSTNGVCEECVEIEIDLASYGYSLSTCEESKTYMSRMYDGFEDFSSCFTHTTAGVDMMLRCSDGGAASSSDNTGMIVGIVIGCIFLVAGIITFVFCMRKQNKL